MIEDDIRILFAKTAAKTRKDYADSLREIKIYVGQDHLLWNLWQKDGLSQTKLCELMGCEPPTLTNMVKKLEVYGLVTRRKDSLDARVTRVFLTEKGSALEYPITNIWENHQKKMLSGISTEDQEILKRLLQKIDANLHI